MAEALKCEKLVHGVRYGRRVKDKESGEFKTVGASTHHPYKCERPAILYKVSGDSYTAFATLCKIHRACAEREGFKMEPQ